MSQPTTIQMRQQEMHRPFQPLDSTEGRTGKAIAEPQETYAGWANIIQDVTGRMAKLYASTSRGSSKEDDPQLQRVEDLYSEAAYKAGEHISSWSEAEQQAWKLNAAAVGQTPEGLLKNWYHSQVVEQARAEGIPWRKIMDANKDYFKPEVKGMETYEQRQFNFNKSMIDWAIQNNVAVTDQFGNVRQEATLEYMDSVAQMASYSILNPEEKEQVIYGLVAPGFNPIAYARGTPEQKQIYDAKMIQGIAKQPFYTEALNTALMDVRKAIGDGSIGNYRDAIQATQAKLTDIEYEIRATPAPSSVKEALLAQVTSFKNNILTPYENRPDRSLKDFDNSLQVAQIEWKIRGLLRSDEIGQIARVRAMLGEQAASELIKTFVASNPQAFGVGKELGLAVQNVNPQQLISLNNVAGNFTNILSGGAATYGTQEDQLQGAALAQQYSNQTVQELNRQPDSAFADIEGRKQKASAVSNWSYQTAVAANAVANDRYLGSSSNKDQYLGNYRDMLNNEDYIKFLTRPSEERTRNLIIQTTPEVTTAILQHPSMSGVLKQVEPAEDRWITYDPELKQFTTGQARFGFQEGTHNWTMNRITNELNKVLVMDINSKQLEMNRNLTDKERADIAKNIFMQLRVMGVNKDLLVEPVMPETNKTNTPK